MKRFASSLVAVFSVLFAANVFAASTEITSGQTIGPSDDTGASHTCVLLGERISVSLSSDVVAAFECEETTSAIDIGTCHEAGQRATRTITCENFAADGETPVWNVSTCDTEGNSVTVETSYTGYVASSTGGAVQEAPLQGACSAANLGSLGLFN